MIDKLKSGEISDDEILDLLKLLDDMRWALASTGGPEFSWLQDRSEDMLRVNQHRLYQVTKDLNRSSLLIKSFNKIYYDIYLK